MGGYVHTWGKSRQFRRHSGAALTACLLAALVPVPRPAAAEIRWINPGSEPVSQESGESAGTTDAARLQENLTALVGGSPGSGSQTRHVVVQLTGPVTADQQADLEARGLKLLTYLGDNAFFAVLLPVGNAKVLAQSVVLADVLTVRRDWKLHPAFATGNVPDWAVVPAPANLNQRLGSAPLESPASSAGGSLVAAYVLFHGDVPLNPDAAAICQRHGGRVRASITPINALVVELPLASIPALADEDAVQWIEPPLPRLGEVNDGVRNLVQADAAQAAPYGLDGSGVDVLLYDGGTAWAEHEDFGGRLTVRDASGLSYHATHVAGTIGGSGSASAGKYRGIAPAVTIESYGFEYDGSGIFLYTNPGDIEADYREAIQSYGARIASNSIGTNLASNGFPCEYEGDYGVTSMLIDAIVNGSLGEPVRVVWSNGNERSSGRCGRTYHTTAPPACAKNPIAVGAVNSNDDSMTWFSSWGPTDDGRLKPDLCAPGCQVGGDGGVTSTAIDGGYRTLCGTSMACPAVAGMGALLLQQWRLLNPDGPLPGNATLKAVLVQSAEDLGPIGPDYQSGYGSARVRDAVDLVRGGQVTQGLIAQGQIHTFLIRVPAGTRALKATLAWDDPPAAPNVVAALVNDLDLVAIAPGGEKFYPWTLDPDRPDQPAVRTQPDRFNNLEQIVVDAPTTGNWVIQVKAFSVPMGPQSFSLVASPAPVACSSAGTIVFGSGKVACNASASLTVNDCDLNQDPDAVESVTVTVTSPRQPNGLSVVLTETGPSTAMFAGSVPLSESPVPGRLQVSDGDMILASYFDADNGSGVSVRVAASAVADCASPQIAGVTVSELAARRAVVAFTTSEPTLARVRYGTTCSDLNLVANEPGCRTSHSVVLDNLTPAGAFSFAVEVQDEAGLQAFDDRQGQCYSFTTPDAPDYFAQQVVFDADAPDHRSIMFTPNGSIDFYAACVEPISELPVNPADGVWLKNGGEVALPTGARVSLYGVSYGRFFVNIDGFITFTRWDNDAVQSLANHFAMPRISALLGWYYTPEAGHVSYKQLSDRYAVTWEHVQDASTQRPSTCQVEMFFDGRIRLSWLEIGTYRPIIGLSAGHGMPADFAESDLKSLPACVADPLAIDPRGGLFAIGLQGGPFEPACRTYRLTNRAEGTGEIAWTAQTSESWLSVAPSGGALPAGEGADVQVCVNAQANNLSAQTAEYCGIVRFRDVGSGIEQVREVQLSVSATAPPVAHDLLATTKVDTPVQVTLVAEDDGRPAGTLTYVLATPPGHGQLSGIGGGVWTYTPQAGFAGVDEFTYRASDGGSPPGGGESGEAKVSVRVIAPPRLPGPPDPPDGAGDVPVDWPTLAAGTAEASLLRSAIVAAAHPWGETEPYFTDPRDKLVATGRFHEVAIVDVGRKSPTLSDLRAFDSVIVWSDDQFNDPFTLGDRLADYVDAGGGVVLAVFANTDVRSFGNLQGRFVSDDYFCLDYPLPTHVGALLDGPRLLLGDVFDRLHPTMADVGSFDGGARSFRPYSAYLATGARFVANWSDGAPLVAVREVSGTPRVDLGMYPVSSNADSEFWDAATDGALILANSLAYAGSRSGAATTYDVYFAANNPPATLVARGLPVPRSPMPGPLQYGTTYYWRIVAHNCAGTTESPVFAFSTPPAAHAAVSDSIPEAQDLRMPFGQIVQGQSRTEQVAICNADPATDLIVTGLSLGRLPEYREDFSDALAQNWQPTRAEDWQIVDGAYRASPPTFGSFLQSTFAGATWQDAWVRCTLRRTGGPDWAAVLALRASDDFVWGDEMTGSACMVGISGNGMFYVGRYLNGQFAFVQPWSYCPALKMLTGVNDVTVNASGPHLAVYLNGTLAWSGSDDSITSAGRIALMGYAGDLVIGQTYVFDDVEVGPALPESGSGPEGGLGLVLNALPGGTPMRAPDDPRKRTDAAHPTINQAPAAAAEGTTAPNWAAGFFLEGLPALPITIGPGACTTVQVTFAPDVQGPHRCGLFIETNDATDSRLAVELTGTGGPGYLSAVPTEPRILSGPQGGPFEPTCSGYTLGSTSSGPLDWTAEANVDWLDVRPAGGTLAAGGSAAVQVCLNDQAGLLPPGTHAGVVTFHDLAANLSIEREIRLGVCALPSVPGSPQPADGADGVRFDTPLAWNIGLADPQRCLAIGSGNVTYSSWNQVVATVLTVEERQTLLEVRPRLVIDHDMDLYFVLADSPQREGPFVPLLVNKVRVSAAGQATYSSGTVHVTLEPARFYAVGVAWGNDQVGFGLDYQRCPVAWELGTIEGYVDDYAAPPAIGPLTRFASVGLLPMELCLVQGGVLTYDVYFGPAGQDRTRICTDLAEPLCPLPGPLDYDTAYFWQVVAANPCGTRAGGAWSFTTGSCQQYPPMIDRAAGRRPVLRRSHGAAGPRDLDLIAPAVGLDVSVDGRIGGGPQIILHFTRLVQGVGGLDAADVRLVSSSGADVPIQSLALDVDQLTIGLADLPDGRYRLSLPGIADAARPDCLVPDTLCFAVLAGDVDGNAVVNQPDLVRVRGRLLMAVTDSTFRYDVNCSGQINAVDMVLVRGRFGHAAPPQCP